MEYEKELIHDLELLKKWEMKWYYYIPILGFLLVHNKYKLIKYQLETKVALSPFDFTKKMYVKNKNGELARPLYTKVIGSIIMLIIPAILAIISFTTNLPINQTIDDIGGYVLAALVISLILYCCFAGRRINKCFIQGIKNVNEEILNNKNNPRY